MYAYYNGSLVEEALINSISAGLQFGYGVFETMLAADGVPCFADMHYERLMKACDIMGLHLELTLEELVNQSAELSKQADIDQGRLKVICFRDIDRDSVLITLAAYSVEEDLLEKGYALRTSSIKRNPYSPLSYIKSLNYAENIIARAEANKHHYNEALFLNVHNKLAEGSVSNIFFVKENKLYTPAVECGILDGITRRQVIAICCKLGIMLHEGSYKLKELMEADEVFVTNSLIGIMPVRRVDNTTYNIGEYKLINIIKEEYKRLVGVGFHANLCMK